MSGASKDSITQHSGHVHACCRTVPVLISSNSSQTPIEAARGVSIQHRGIAPCRYTPPYRPRQYHRPRISILSIIRPVPNYKVPTLLPREHVKTRLHRESHHAREICVPRPIRVRCPRCSRGPERDDAGFVHPRVGHCDELPCSRRRVPLVERQEGLGLRREQHLIGKRATMRREGRDVGPGWVTWDRVGLAASR